MKLLLAEDDLNLGELLASFLENKGYDVDLVRNGKIAFQQFNQKKYDFCILDVMMPEMDGFTVAKEIRELDKQTPILFLTAKTMKEDKLQGFEAGGDDYLTKPFSMEELLARITAIMRRVKGDETSEDESYQIGGIKFEPTYRKVAFG